MDAVRLTVLVAVHRNVSRGVEAAPAVDVQPARLFELVLGVLGRLAAERPVALVVEDLHWGDRDTRDLLAFLVRALRGVPVLLVATYRSDELQRGHDAVQRENLGRRFASSPRPDPLG